MSEDAADTLEFEAIFDLQETHQTPPSEAEAVRRPDPRGGEVYCMPKPLHLAVEVALTTGRPLLLRGNPGTGKSSVAPYVARRLGWRYYEHVVTSTSSATELQWRFDAVRRLADAQAQKLEDDAAYVEPGVLWWALNRESALQHGEEPEARDNDERDPHRAVVLVDEIDKAHPDLPNGLLVTLGSNQISVPYLDTPILAARGARPLPLPRGVAAAPIQVIVTTNEERELPAAFVRRCITFRLSHPDPDRLVEIARAHFDRPREPFRKTDEKLALAIARRVETLRGEAQPGEHRPSTAEFLDAFRACRRRKIRPDESDERWKLVEQVTLAKSGPRAGA